MPIPDEAERWANEANAKFVDEDYAGALELYSQAVAAAPDCAELLVRRAQVHIKIGEMGNLNHNFWSARDDACRAIELDASNVMAYLRKGVAHFHLQEYDVALSAFNQGTELDPNNVQIQRWTMKCMQEVVWLGDTQELESLLGTPMILDGPEAASDPETEELNTPMHLDGTPTAASEAPRDFAGLPQGGNIDDTGLWQVRECAM